MKLSVGAYRIIWDSMRACIMAVLCLHLSKTTAAHVSRSGLGHWQFFGSQLQAFLGNVPAVAEASGGRSGTEDAVQLSITYKHDTHVGNGNIIAKSKVRKEPQVQIVGAPSGGGAESPIYTLLMVDPDAPSPDHPKWADFLHWAVTNITRGDASSGNVLMKYMGPAPLEGTHRYIFSLWWQMPGHTIGSRARYLIGNRKDGPSTQVAAIEDRKQFNVAKFAKDHNLQGPIQKEFFRVKA